MPAKLSSIDDYLARVPADRQRALRTLRATIRSLLPDAEECISYSMPAFRYEGHVVAGFLATSKGCSYFPFSGTTLATLADELRAYDQTKSALHFEPAKPLSKSLVKTLLQARIAETQRSRGSKAKGAKKSKARAVKTNGVAKSSTSRVAKTDGAGKASKARDAKTNGARTVSKARNETAARSIESKKSRAVRRAK